MLEKINLSLKASIRLSKLKKIAHNILKDKSCDIMEKQNHPVAIQRLTEVLNDYLRLNHYEKLPHQHEINALLRENFFASGLLYRQIHGNHRSESDLCYNEYSTSFAPRSTTVQYFPISTMPHNIAIDAIRTIFIKTLKQHYPHLLNNKTALTILCIKKFHPQSFFSRVPKDIIKVILKHTENMEKFQPSRKHYPGRW